LGSGILYDASCDMSDKIHQYEGYEENKQRK